MLTDDASECLRQGEDEVEVGYGEQFTATPGRPIFRVLAVTLGTVAIAAGMIGVLLVANPRRDSSMKYVRTCSSVKSCGDRL